MKKALAIFGAGGHGRVVADCALAAGWERISLFDDGRETVSGPWTVEGDSRALIARIAQFDGFVMGIGDNGQRLGMMKHLVARGARLVTLVHPSAIVSTHAQIGLGSVVLAGAVVGVGARLGQAVIVNTGATVDHDCELEDGVHIAPGAHLAGGVTVGAESWIGLGAVVRECIAIGTRVVVGAGTVVIEPISDGLTVVGVPARALKR